VKLHLVGWPACGLLSAAILGLNDPVAAQSGLTGGAFRPGPGRAGRAVARAQVSVAGANTGVTRRAATDAGGRYVLAALPLDVYRLQVEAEGFHTSVREGLAPAVGQVLVVDVYLAVARSEVVWVERQGTGDRNEGAAVSSLVAARPIEGLPTNGRDFVAFTLLAPGVVAERTPPTGPTTSSGLSFAGQRARSNHIMVDGFDNDDAFTGGVAAAFSQDAVREFRCWLPRRPPSSATPRAGP
jgi:hypothetical protein